MKRQAPSILAILRRLGLPIAGGGGGRASAKLSPEQLEARTIERAFRCGARYSARRWLRRAPPRMRCRLVGRAGYGLLLAQQQAFYRGYDAATRARIDLGRAWDEPWKDAA